ncbi:hemophore [Yersinia aldovae ATCC 35236]|uniref:Hemophore n=1 Tax=Yersinia aldovae TaxID=29483 RepID=A0A0T9ULL6_YERAL|nr:heme acquisition protein HasA [Yersinia aldovae]EEP94207.1 hemophore [Yersinia aldovae ATCC 35236]CNL51634.1 hemophore [Yersinia aldovae]
MTITIKYDKSIKDETISTYTHQWATDFGDLIEVAHTTRYYGTFSGSLDYNNRIISAEFESPIEGSNTAIIFSGTLFGSDGGAIYKENYIQSLEFGASVIPANAGNTNEAKQLEQVQLKFEGLNIEGDFGYSLCSISRALNSDPGKPYQGGIDHGTYSLIRGKAGAMLEHLKAQGIDVDIPLKDLAIASQFASSEVITDVPIPVIDTVGVVDNSDISLVA